MKEFFKSTLNQAGLLLKENFKEDEMIQFKETLEGLDYNQPITKRDFLIEDFLIKKINFYFPDCNIISEEKESNIFDLDRPTWVIDPIDGTMNFSRGIKFFCIAMSFWENNICKYAGVFFPEFNEFYFAEKNKGVWLNGKPIKVSKVKDINSAVIIISGPDSFYKTSNIDSFYRITSNVKNLRIFSSSILDQCLVASGKSDARIYANSKFWDSYSIKVIIEEAGGMITNWKGEQNDLFNPLVIISNKILHKKILNLIYDKTSR